MLYVNESAKQLVKCSSSKADESWVVIDDDLANKISEVYFGKRVYGDIELSDDSLLEILTLNETFINNRKDAEAKNASTFSESSILELAAKDVEKANTFDYSAFRDKIERDSAGHYIAYKNTNKSYKSYKTYIVQSADVFNKTFVIYNYYSSATERKPRCETVTIDELYNGEAIYKALKKEAIEKLMQD